MTVADELLSEKPRFGMGCGTSSLVSSRVRLARNVNGIAFPGWAGEEESRRLWRWLRPELESLKSMSGPVAVEIEEIDAVARETLVERHLMSREMAQKGAGSGIVARRDETVSIMVNEEDHLRIQAMSPGLDLYETWKLIESVDSEVESIVDYAFSPRMGYLTACPTNVGTGMRASVMMHLPGLRLANEIKPVINGVSKIGMAVRGLWGEGTDAYGNMFQVSNQVTLGENEETIVKSLEQVVMELAEHEKNARERLLQRKPAVLRDCVGRAIGLLTHAHLLDTGEALSLLSHVRLGIELGMVSEWDRGVIDELFMLVQPGHLQRHFGKTIGAAERDVIRARLVKERLVRQDGREGET